MEHTVLYENKRERRAILLSSLKSKMSPYFSIPAHMCIDIADNESRDFGTNNTSHLGVGTTDWENIYCSCEVQC